MSICASASEQATYWGNKILKIAQDHDLKPTVRIQPFGHPGYAVIYCEYDHSDWLYSLDKWGFNAFLGDLPRYSRITFVPQFKALAAKAGIDIAIGACVHWPGKGEYSVNKNGFEAFARRFKKEFPNID